MNKITMLETTAGGSYFESTDCYPEKLFKFFEKRKNHCRLHFTKQS